MPSDVVRMKFDTSNGFQPWHSDPQKGHEGLMNMHEVMDQDCLGNYHLAKRPFELDGKMVPGFYAIVWKETGTVLGMAKDKYRCIQPMDLVGGFFDPIVSRGEAIYKTAGILRDGMQFWALAELTEAKYHIEMPNGVKALPYILLTGWNDGVHACSACHTSIIVQCRNTADAAMQMAIADDTRPMVTFRHNASAKENIAAGHKILALADKRTQILRDIYAKMGKIKMGNLDIQSLLQKLLPSKRENDGKEADKRISNEREKILMAYDDPVNFTDETRGTAWNLYMATTYWIDHTRQEVKRNGATIDRNFSSMLGSGADLRQVAMNWFLEQMKGGETDGDFVDPIAEALPDDQPG